MLREVGYEDPDKDESAFNWMDVSTCSCMACQVDGNGTEMREGRYVERMKSKTPGEASERQCSSCRIVTANVCNG